MLRCSAAALSMCAQMCLCFNRMRLDGWMVMMMMVMKVVLLVLYCILL